jgi:D-alanyl-D-alanine carboxypeptidase
VSGVRKFGDPTLATTQDEWHLGSDTKAMTATLIGLYVDRGRIHFEDTIGSIFSTETVDPGYANVTIEELLRNIGGTPGVIPSDIWSQMWADGSSPDARIKAVRSLISRPPAQAVGKFEYSNAGFMIAGAALERVTGTSWEQLMQNALFAPLQMDSCGFGPPGTSGQVDEPWGHQSPSGGGDPVPQPPGSPSSDNPPSLGPADTVHCSLLDWGKFLGMHLAGARGKTTMLAQATMQRLHTPPAGGHYASGWIVTSSSWSGSKALTHDGSNTFWYVTAWLSPAKNLTFVVVTNRGEGSVQTEVDAALAALTRTYAP